MLCGLIFPYSKIDKYFLCFFIIRSFGDEFRSIFGDILSYLSSNVSNEAKTFNSSSNTEHLGSNFDSDVFKRLQFVISYQVHMLIFCILLIPAMLFINYKLFQVVRKSRRNKRISPDMKKTFSYKVLRTEGWKVLKSMKICRRVES